MKNPNDFLSKKIKIQKKIIKTDSEYITNRFANYLASKMPIDHSKKDELLEIKEIEKYNYIEEDKLLQMERLREYLKSGNEEELPKEIKIDAIISNNDVIDYIRNKLFIEGKGKYKDLLSKDLAIKVTNLMRNKKYLEDIRNHLFKKIFSKQKK